MQVLSGRVDSEKLAKGNSNVGEGDGFKRKTVYDIRDYGRSLQAVLPTRWGVRIEKPDRRAEGGLPGVIHGRSRSTWRFKVACMLNAA